MEPLLQVEHLTVTYETRLGPVRAVDDVSFTLHRGEVLGLVGESGCGKSTLGMALLRMVRPPGRITGGHILFQGRDLLQLSEEEMRRLRGRHISMVFQDPMTSLNPLQRIGDHIVETIRVHEPQVSKQEAWERAAHLVQRLGISPDRLKDYPHQLSGGMRQRIMIGIGLALNADLIIADEPTTSLDVIVEAQFLDLLRELREEFNLTLILITHNIGIVAELADRVAVMYAGRMAEIGPVHDIFHRTLHPYTQGLLASVPSIRLEDGLELATLSGAPPSLLDPPLGCRFHPRCPQAMPVCAQYVPPWQEVHPGHGTACWLYTEEDA
ncbi:MAG TPA: ABC transporter ATP-binding protein [Anaerolineae bacterium]|nr:ABC transporter ATP-binding protein [Anaerolineae bacterium]HID84085.1 ABC transporter ATP-binding protein [Anaerolineales bacterium]HIQ08719.1 ABC transporter ATP-binding protein [Anaerolineaceae bacterium]